MPVFAAEISVPPDMLEFGRGDGFHAQHGQKDVVIRRRRARECLRCHIRGIGRGYAAPATGVVVSWPEITTPEP